MQITGLILAGGRSSRMDGRDKGLLLLKGKPMIEHVIRRLEPQVSKIIISANPDADSYYKYACDVIHDDFKNHQGPLAGILQALACINSGYLLTVPCDGPLLPLDLGSRMLTQARIRKSGLAMVFDGEYRQPAYNLIHCSLLANLSTFLDSGERKLGQWLMNNKAEQVNFSDQRAAFMNINTPQDLTTLEAQPDSIF